MTAAALRLETDALSHAGLVRELNEDRAYADPHTGVWAVADGMGGHYAGDFASEAIVRHLRTGVVAAPSAQMLDAAFRGALQQAHEEIITHAGASGNSVIGSTFVGLIVYGQMYRCCWCGDSRAYMLRDDTLVKLTRDHTEVQELLDRGALTVAEADHYPRRNVITRAVGVGGALFLDHVDGALQAGDCFLLCSDGLTAHLSDLEIGQIMTGRRAREICQELVGMALSRGGTDNVTVNVVQFYAKAATVLNELPIATAILSGAEK